MCRLHRIPALLTLLTLTSTASAQTPAPAPKTDALRDLSLSIENLSRRASRAVVQIFSTGYSFRSSEEGEGAQQSSLFAKERSSGSGVIVSADGYIVTNNHVVQGARRVEVQLTFIEQTPGHHSILRRHGKLMEAKVIGTDRESDLAVIKIEGTGLPHLPFGDSDELRQGQLVLAFGNPLGLENSVTMGVVSSVGRQLKPDDPMVYVQTDAPINPGNSGGPLLDPDGRVMGINTFIITQSGGSEGIGFAIPSNIASNVYRQIRKSGHVHRGEIGVFAQSITPELAMGLRLPQDTGVLLSDVQPEGPADKAGLKVGDIVLSLDGKPMENARQFQVNLYRVPISTKVNVEVLREGEKLTAHVPVGERENDPQRFADLVDPEKNSVPKLGILGIQVDKQVAEMLPDMRFHYGVVVAAKGSGSAYYGRVGLQPGDVIYSINGTPIADIAKLRDTVDKLRPADPLVIQIERDGQLMYLTLTTE